MISYLRGKIIFKGEKFVVLDVNGVGYKIFLAKQALNRIQQEKGLLNFFCYLNVREKALDLYGFLRQEELGAFETLIDLPSIGPKAALGISSLGPIEKIKEALEKEDEKVIKEIFNIGKKKAQLIILELSRKIKMPPREKPALDDEAFQALVGLGFSRQKIKETLAKLPKEIKDSEEKVKEALKILRKT